jgi:hypothetical protein
MFNSEKVALLVFIIISLLPLFRIGKLSSSKMGNPFLSVFPFKSVTFAVSNKLSMTKISFEASLPISFNSSPFVVIVTKDDDELSIFHFS